MAGTARRALKTAAGTAAAQGATVPKRAPTSMPQQTGHNKIRRLRLWQRSVVRMPAALLRAGRRSPTLVRDLSRHGAGLVGEGGLERDEIVALELAGGRILFGRVRWRVGMHAGIAFDVALAADDPLLDAAPPLSSLRRAENETVTDEPSSGRWHTSDNRMLARACREQGFAWLVEPGDEL